MHPARNGLTALSSAVVIIFTGAGCSTSPGSATGPLRRVNHDGSKAAMGLNVKPGLPYELPMPPVCTTTGEPAKIDSVTPWNLKGGHIRIVDWGVRTGRGPEIGAEQMTVAQVVGFNHDPVTVKCSGTKVQEFDISASTTDARATMDGVTVRYNGNKIEHMQFGIALCARPGSDCPYNFT